MDPMSPGMDELISVITSMTLHRETQSTNDAIDTDSQCLLVVCSATQSLVLEYWWDNWTVSDVTGHAGVTGQYLANAIISDKSK